MWTFAALVDVNVDVVADEGWGDEALLSIV